MTYSIEFTKEEWNDILEWITVMDDSSYAHRIAETIAKKVKRILKTP